jgi:hypothetical protein
VILGNIITRRSLVLECCNTFRRPLTIAPTCIVKSAVADFASDSNYMPHPAQRKEDTPQFWKTVPQRKRGRR